MVPNTKWQKDTRETEVKEINLDPGVVVFIPSLHSVNITESPQAKELVPPNFQQQLVENYLGDINRLDKDQKALAMDCYTKHLRSIDLMNKGAADNAKVVGFAYAVEQFKCVSYYFLEDEYKRSIFAALDGVEQQCFVSQELGQLKIPLRFNKAENYYLTIDGDNREPALEGESFRGIKAGFDFWNQKGNIAGTFRGPAAPQLEKEKNGSYLEAEFGYDQKPIRGQASVAEEGHLALRFYQTLDGVNVELRLKREGHWGEWEKLQNCYQSSVSGAEAN